MVHSEHNVDESLSVLRMGRHQRDDLIQKIEDTVCRITTPFRTNNGFGKIIKLEKISRGYISLICTFVMNPEKSGIRKI